MVGHLERALAFVGHVAVGAGHAGLGVCALVPHLEFGVLRLQDLGACLRVLPVVEAVAIVEFEVVVGGFDFLDLKPVHPGEEQGGLGAAVVLDVALAAHERAHLLPGGVPVRVVVGDALVFFQGLDAIDEARAGHA